MYYHLFKEKERELTVNFFNGKFFFRYIEIHSGQRRKEKSDSDAQNYSSHGETQVIKNYNENLNKDKIHCTAFGGVRQEVPHLRNIPLLSLHGDKVSKENS